jgi:hypothetical protein
MSADYFIRGVAFDALRTRIPAGHNAIGVELENRIIDHCFN